MGAVLGSRISAMLEKSNMTQKELAEHLHITDATMSRYINGSRDPKPETIAKLATALKTTSDSLLGLENEQEEFNHPRIKRLLARNAKKITEKQKKELIDALFFTEE